MEQPEKGLFAYMCVCVCVCVCAMSIFGPYDTTGSAIEWHGELWMWNHKQGFFPPPILWFLMFYNFSQKNWDLFSNLHF